MMNEDEVELRRLVDRYAACMDALDAEAFESLWAPGGVLEVFQEGPAAASTGAMTAGRHFHFAFERLAAYQRTIHHVTTHVAEVDGDEATGITCCEAHHIDRPGGDDATDLVMHIRYEDRYARHDGSWRFTYRKVGVLLLEHRRVQELR